MYLLLSVFCLYCNPSVGQNSYTQFIDAKGDTILRMFDEQERLIEQYVNGRIQKKITYNQPDSIVLGDLLLSVNKFTKPTFTYNLVEGDTVTINITSVKQIKSKKYKPSKHHIVNLSNCQIAQNIGKESINQPDFERNQHVFIQHCKKKKIRLKQVDFVQGEKGNRFSNIETCQINWRDIIKEKDEYTIAINNIIRLKNRKVCLSIVKRPKVEEVVTHFTSDTIIMEDTLSYITYDTTLIPILDKIVSLAPLRDIEHPSFHIEQLNLDELAEGDVSLTRFAYWMGVGQNAQKHYESLEEAIPDDWVEPGISKPLGAFVMGKEIAIPGLISGKTYVGFQDSISLQMNKSDLKLNDLKQYKLTNKYLAKGLTLTKYSPFKNSLVLANQDPINAPSIRVIIIAQKIIPKIAQKVVQRTVIGQPELINN